MTDGQILQLIGAATTGICVYFLSQIVLWLMAQPPKPSTTDKKAGKK